MQSQTQNDHAGLSHSFFKFSLLCEQKNLTAANLISRNTFLFPGNDLELIMNSKELLGRNILIKDAVV